MCLVRKGIGLFSSSVSLHQFQIRSKNGKKGENFFFHDVKVEFSLVQISWNDVISFLAYRKPIKLEIGNVGFRTRAYPIEKWNQSFPPPSGATPSRGNGRKIGNVIKKYLSQLNIGKINFHVQLFNSEFDQSETTWELITEQIKLAVDEEMVKIL